MSYSKYLIVSLINILLISSVQAGVFLTIEDGKFPGSKDTGLHATEIEWTSGTKIDGDGPFRLGYGINQVLYTPSNLQNPNMPPPSERPWCGTLSVYREVWQRSSFGNEEIRTRYEVGILGPAAFGEESQIYSHSLLNYDSPLGWKNQLPNELMFNVYHDRYRLLWEEINDKWIADVKLIYGATSGSTFINTRVGGQLRAGYNIPANSLPGGIEPKLSKDETVQESGFFAYLVAEVDEFNVVKNATISNSIYNQREPGQDRSLETIVWFYRYGLVAGYNSFSISYMLNHRTSEFKEQTNGGMSWGMIRLEFMYQF